MNKSKIIKHWKTISNYDFLKLYRMVFTYRNQTIIDLEIN